MKDHLTLLSVRLTALDGLRGSAALGVAITHAYPAQTFWLGWSLVDLFFVLSGFLIGSILLDSRIHIPGFLARRILRIWPVYHVTLVLALAASDLRIAVNPAVAEPTGVLPSSLRPDERAGDGADPRLHPVVQPQLEARFPLYRDAAEPASLGVSSHAAKGAS